MSMSGVSKILFAVDGHIRLEKYKSQNHDINNSAEHDNGMG